jgi:hypothetical protein
LLSDTKAESGSIYDLTLYDIAKGDSLKIAKEFRTTIQEIISLNPQNGSRLASGRAVLVYRRKRE